ncbi:MAG: signal recognition particle subunit SRP19/SEC65 family protein [Methanoregula sp.]|nr:signal recognition particle subunit SRP19/SEC65 family protein [Methanoregula sp.]
MADECILYPCYFNAALKRSQGRRVSRQSGAKAPSLAEIERALKRSGLKFSAEDHHHPAHWERHEGRVVVEWKKGKGALIKKVAQQMEGKR